MTRDEAFATAVAALEEIAAEDWRIEKDSNPVLIANRALLAILAAPQLSVPAEPRDMTDAETAAHLREYVKQQHSTFSWPTDTCGYDQHIRFVEHRNKNWQAAHDGGETFDQFVLAYADSLDPPAAPPAGTGRRDPRDKAGCACPRIDGRRCIEFRSSPTAQLDFDEECECWCHDIYERNLREAEEDESECDECGAITKERE